jgi:hypothetical protein
MGAGGVSSVLPERPLHAALRHPDQRFLTSEHRRPPRACLDRLTGCAQLSLTATRGGAMIRKLKSGEYRLYSRKTNRKRESGAISERSSRVRPPRSTSVPFSTSSEREGKIGTRSQACILLEPRAVSRVARAQSRNSARATRRIPQARFRARKHDLDGVGGRSALFRLDRWRRRRIDAHSYTIRFTPRKPSSIWSTVNITKMRELTPPIGCIPLVWPRSSGAPKKRARSTRTRTGMRLCSTPMRSESSGGTRRLGSSSSSVRPGTSAPPRGASSAQSAPTHGRSALRS